MFSICANMEFAHLPNAGGIYDQDPRLMDIWEQIWAEKAKFQSEQEAERERKSKASARARK